MVIGPLVHIIRIIVVESIKNSAAIPHKLRRIYEVIEGILSQDQVIVVLSAFIE